MFRHVPGPRLALAGALVVVLAAALFLMPGAQATFNGTAAPCQASPRRRSRLHPGPVLSSAAQAGTGTVREESRSSR